MNLLNLFNPLQTAGMEEEFDAIKSALLLPKPSAHGLTAKLKSPKPSTIVRSNLSVTVCSAPKSLVRSKTTNACAENINA